MDLCCAHDRSRARGPLAFFPPSLLRSQNPEHREAILGLLRNVIDDFVSAGSFDGAKAWSGVVDSPVSLNYDLGPVHCDALALHPEQMDCIVCPVDGGKSAREFDLVILIPQVQAYSLGLSFNWTCRKLPNICDDGLVHVTTSRICVTISSRLYLLPVPRLEIYEVDVQADNMKLEFLAFGSPLYRFLAWYWADQVQAAVESSVRDVVQSSLDARLSDLASYISLAMNTSEAVMQSVSSMRNLNNSSANGDACGRHTQLVELKQSICEACEVADLGDSAVNLLVEELPQILGNNVGCLAKAKKKVTFSPAEIIAILSSNGALTDLSKAIQQRSCEANLPSLEESGEVSPSRAAASKAKRATRQLSRSGVFTEFSPEAEDTRRQSQS